MAVGKKIHQYRGHYIYPGRLEDSEDDVLGTWYVVHEDMDDVVTSGRGHETLAAAKESIDQDIGKTSWKYTKLWGEWMAVGTVQNRDWAGHTIVVGTARGEKHVRKVVEVASQDKIQGNKVLTYVTLAPDSQVEENASKRLIATRVDGLLEELESRRRYFLKTHETAFGQLHSQELDSSINEVLSGFGALSRALESYRTSSVPRKHPSPTWLAETQQLVAHADGSDQK